MIHVLALLPLLASLQAVKQPLHISVNLHAALQVEAMQMGVKDKVFPIQGQTHAAVVTPATNPKPEATLRWRNGETLSGSIARSSETALSWNYSGFKDPLEIDWKALDRISWPLAQVVTQEPFSFSMKNGSFLYGDVVSIGPDFVEMKSARNGEVQLRRSEVLSIRRLFRRPLISDGPCGTIGWHIVEPGTDGFTNMGPRFPDFTLPVAIGQNGKILFRNWNRAAFYDAELPERSDISFQISSSVTPEFEMSFGEDIRSALSLETWDKELVLEQGNNFKTLFKVGDDDHVVKLHVLWDKPALKCSVYRDDGTLVSQWDVPAHISSFGPHLILYNKGLNLNLDYLQIRDWDGKSLLEKIDPAAPMVQLSNGQRISSAVESESSGNVTLSKPGGVSNPIPLSKVDELVLNPGTSASPPSPEATLVYNDGSCVCGRLVSISDNKGSFDTSFTSAPVTSILDQPRSLIVRVAPFPSPKQDLSLLDKLNLGAVTLHGNVLWSGDSSFRWNPVGGAEANAARIADNVSYEVHKAANSSSAPSLDPALFYMSNGDVVPGKLQSINHDGVEFESTLTTNKLFTNEQVNAIQFFPSPGYKIKGFDDPAWKILKGDSQSVHIEGNKVEIGFGSSIACPINFKEFTFNLSNKQFFGLRIRLFTSEKDNAKSMNFIVGSYGAQVYSFQETQDGHGNEDQVQTPVKWGQDAVLKIVFNDSHVELYVNDACVLQSSVEASECGGSEMILEPYSMLGNTVANVSLSNFTCSPGAGWVPEFEPEVKKEMLTLPRMRRDNPPCHLLMGENGDLLRGEIDASTDSTFHFHCGTETLDIPRERVRTIIVLKPVDKEKTHAGDYDSFSPTKILDEHLKAIGRLRISFGRIALSDLVNYLCSQWVGTPIHVPDQQILGQIAFSGQSTLRGVLDRICLAYGVQYRVDRDGSIYLEMPDSLGELPRKSYWVKPDKFPKNAALQDLFVSKGIPFPKNASLTYDEASGLLSVSNTEENQAKLSAMLNSDFGGTLGSPTHWFSLASGGEISLASTKFAPDFVQGENPLYGTCKIPAADIVEVQSMPFPASSHTLGSWRLIAAPEPVIPQSGGDSPLIGKIAPIFDSDLLDGTKFSLSAEKGKIVVLDFWATWCGPCVKALPELINAMAAFPKDKVELIGVNQGEPKEQITRFLKSHGLELSVAQDPDQKTGAAYGIEAIPRTIIVGPDGNVVWDETGYDPDNPVAVSSEIKKLMGNSDVQK